MSPLLAFCVQFSGRNVTSILTSSFARMTTMKVLSVCKTKIKQKQKVNRWDILHICLRGVEGRAYDAAWPRPLLRFRLEISRLTFRTVIWDERVCGLIHVNNRFVVRKLSILLSQL